MQKISENQKFKIWIHIFNLSITTSFYVQFHIKKFIINLFYFLIIKFVVYMGSLPACIYISWNKLQLYFIIIIIIILKITP
jgi:hypothetical protein